MDWQDPSPVTTAPASNPKRADDVERLREFPGQWALLSEHASFRAARTIKARLRKRWPDYEFAARTGTDKEGLLYGRFPEPKGK